MTEFYLKQVVLLLKCENTVSRFHSLSEALQEKGITMQAYLADEEFPILREVLYITDSETKANALRKQSLPILGFSYEQGDSLSEINYIMEEPEELDAEYLERVYRRYRDIPWDILVTSRCCIRESVVEDAEGFFAVYASPEVVKYTEGLLPDIEQQKAYIRDYIDKMYRYYEFGVWTVLSKETGEIIGRAGFSVRDGYELPELGFVIAPKWQGQGIAYEICDAILEYGWKTYEFESVQALVMPENTSSLNLCRKLGFRQEEKVYEKGMEYIKLTIEKPLS